MRLNILRAVIQNVFFIAQTENKYTIYKKLNDIEEEINHRAFLRCHQSYLVNMNKIESVENDFTMKSGDVVPIRTRNLNEIKKEYYNYIEYRG